NRSTNPFARRAHRDGYRVRLARGHFNPTPIGRERSQLAMVDGAEVIEIEDRRVFSAQWNAQKRLPLRAARHLHCAVQRCEVPPVRHQGSPEVLISSAMSQGRPAGLANLE